MASLPYPRRPPNSFHRTHSKFVCASPPTEFTEASGGGYSPTDFTDFHRSRRVWHPCHTHAALRIPSTEPTPSLFAQVLPQNSQNSQKFLAKNILPQISQIFTEVGGYGIPAIPTPPSEFLPQNPLQVCLRKSSHRIHRIHRNFWRRIFSHRFHRIHRSFWRRRASHGFHRCTQIFLLRQSFLCVPRILWEDSFVAAWVWHPCHTHAALRIPSTEPTPSLLAQVLPQNSQKLQAEDILPQIAQNTQKLLAENSLPQMRTDAHRWLGCVGFSHGIHRIHRSFWRRKASHGFHRCTQIFLLRQSFLCSVNSVGR